MRRLRIGKGYEAMLLFGVSLLWLVLIPWDLSEVDENDRIIAGGGDDVFGSWRAAALGAGTFIMNAAASRGGLPTRRSVVLTVLVGSFWFLWRTGTARTAGANLFIAGWLLFFLPAAVTIAAVGSAAGRRPRLSR